MRKEAATGAATRTTAAAAAVARERTAKAGDLEREPRGSSGQAWHGAARLTKGRGAECSGFLACRARDRDERRGQQQEADARRNIVSCPADLQPL